MANNYVVGAELKIVDLATPAIPAMMREMQALNKIIKAVRLDLGGLTKEFRLASTAAMGLNRAASMTTATAGIARTIAETNKLTAALGRASAAASRIGVGGGGGGNRIRLKATEHYPRLDHG